MFQYKCICCKKARNTPKKMTMIAQMKLLEDATHRITKRTDGRWLIGIWTLYCKEKEIDANTMNPTDDKIIEDIHLQTCKAYILSKNRNVSSCNANSLLTYILSVNSVYF